MDFTNLLLIVFLVKAINGSETLHQIVQLKEDMLLQLSYYQSCAATGEYVYAAFEKDSYSYYQKLSDIEITVATSVSLIKETRNASSNLFDTALNDMKRLKEEGFEKIRMYFYNLYLQGVAYQSQLTLIRDNMTATDEHSLPCNHTSSEYESCLNGVLSFLRSTKAELTTFGTNVCTTFNNPSSDGFGYAQTVYSNNTAAAKEIINSHLTQHAITRAEIVDSFNNKTQSSYDRSMSSYRHQSQSYVAKLKQDMYRKLSTLKIIVAAVDAGVAGTTDYVINMALNTLKTRINNLYTSQYNFITGALNAIDAFDFLGQLSAERDRVNASNMQTQCETVPATPAEFFFCAHELYTSFVSTSDSIYSQYVALIFLDFPKDAPWWRIMYTLPPYINQALPYIQINSNLEQGLICFRDYNIIYRTPEQTEIQYYSCSSYFKIATNY